MAAVEAAAPRLTPLLRLLGSNVDGEVLAAARGLQRVLASHGSDINDLASWFEARAAGSPNADPPFRPQSSPKGGGTWPAFWLKTAERLARDGAGTLDDRDLEFLANIAKVCRAGRSPSGAQRKWLNDIRDKIKGTGNGHQA